MMRYASGTRLGTYEIVAPLGAGGMGEVYRARDLRLGRQVALKVLPEAMARDGDRMARFEREARMVAGLNHPNIVTLFSVEDEGDLHFLIMELVEGQSLADLVTAGGLPLARVVDIGIALAGALSAAHERGVVHRDLKPANVMVDRDGRVKVLDFGLAKLRPADGDLSRASTRRIRSPKPATWRAPCRTWRRSRCAAKGWTRGATCSRSASRSTSWPPGSGRSPGRARPMSARRSCATCRFRWHACAPTCRAISSGSSAAASRRTPASASRPPSMSRTSCAPCSAPWTAAPPRTRPTRWLRSRCSRS